MSFEPTSCPHCGCSQVLSLDRCIDAGVVSEADYHCGRCLRHLGFYAYGFTQEGSGGLPNEYDRRELVRQQWQLAEADEYECGIQGLAQELHESTGHALDDCRHALYCCKGNLAQARAGLDAGKWKSPVAVATA